MIAFLPLPAAADRPRTLLVYDDGPDRAAVLGRVREVADFVWWWRAPGMPHFAPAHGASVRDCVDCLLAARDRPPPPRRGISTSDELLRACRQAQACPEGKVPGGDDG